MKSEKTHFNISQLTIMVMLFLTGLNFLNLYPYFIYAAVLFVVLENKRTLMIDNWFIVLLLLSTCFVIFYPGASTSITVILKQYNYPLCYLIGLNLIGLDNKPSPQLYDQQLKIVIVTIALGSFLHYMLNMIYNFDSTTRNTVDVWTGERIVATGQVCFAIAAIGVFSSWLFSETTKVKKIIAVAGIILAFMYNFILAGRTLFLLTTVSLGVAFVFAARKERISRRVLILLSILFAILFLLLIYSQNLFGVRDWILDSNFSARFNRLQFFEDTRLNNKYAYFAHFFKYPLGGGKLRAEYGYAHDLFLDTYSDSGLIALLLLVAFVIGMVVLLLRFLKHQEVCDDCKLLVLCVYVTIMMEFFLEPILQGVPWVFCMFCVFGGMIKTRCTVQSCYVANVVSKDE